MFKRGKAQESQAQPAESTGTGAGTQADLTRADREAHRMLEELRGQPGFGVVMTASEASPAVQPSTIGQRLTAELEDLARLQKHLMEVRELANRRVADLTTEQLRHIYEFCR